MAPESTNQLTKTPVSAPTQATKAGEITAEGYKRTLSRRHVTIIAMGGAIGVGLFMGAGVRLASTGPALVCSYAIACLLASLLIRALGCLFL